jgi:phosphatidylglycerophosphate synthase
MFDPTLRRLINQHVDKAGLTFTRWGVSADQMTVAAALLGLGGATAIALSAPLAGLVLILAGRIGDGLDGAIARATGGPTDRGGYLDIVLDFAVYATVPLAFAVADPRNALPAAALLASFLVNGAAFLAFAAFAERRKLTTEAQGRKSFYYLAGLMEGGETILFFALFCLLPDWFPPLALTMAALCLVSAVARIIVVAQALTPTLPEAPDPDRR